LSQPPSNRPISATIPLTCSNCPPLSQRHWCGFVVYPTYRRIKGRKVRSACRHLGERLDTYRAGRISFAELDASVKGWVNHIRYADTWGLRRHVFRRLGQRARPG
jgi:RNA-directed DNA polymerase